MNLWRVSIYSNMFILRDSLRVNLILSSNTFYWFLSETHLNSTFLHSILLTWFSCGIFKLISRTTNRCVNRANTVHKFILPFRSNCILHIEKCRDYYRCVDARWYLRRVAKWTHLVVLVWRAVVDVADMFSCTLSSSSQWPTTDFD